MPILSINQQEVLLYCNHKIILLTRFKSTVKIFNTHFVQNGRQYTFLLITVRSTEFMTSAALS